MHIKIYIYICQNVLRSLWVTACMMHVCVWWCNNSVAVAGALR